MNHMFRTLIIILIAGFIGLTFYTSILLIELPIQLMEQLGLPDNTSSTQINTTLSPVFISLGANLLVTILILFLLTSRAFRPQKERVIANASGETSEKPNANQDLGTNFTPREDSFLLLADKIEEQIAGKYQGEEIEGLFKVFCKELEAGGGIAYTRVEDGKFSLSNTYAINKDNYKNIVFQEGDGLVGQVIKSRKILHVYDIPAGYTKIITGLGETDPLGLLIIPLKDRNEIITIFEIALMRKTTLNEVSLWEKLAEDLGNRLFSTNQG